METLQFVIAFALVLLVPVLLLAYVGVFASMLYTLIMGYFVVTAPSLAK